MHAHSEQHAHGRPSSRQPTRRPTTIPPAGQVLAAKRRTSAARGYDFFLEASYVELYNEGCADLLAGGRHEGGQRLPVSERIDALGGWAELH